MPDGIPMGIASSKPRPREKQPIAICGFCGCNIMGYIGGQRRTYCSSVCRSRKVNGHSPDDYIPRECEQCKSYFVPPRRLSKFCSDTCKTKAYNLRAAEKRITDVDIDNTANGLARELLVCSDLLLRGAHVFKSIRNIGPCDIVAMFEGGLYRVESTSGYRKQNGELYWTPHDPEKYDLLAVVFADKSVHYLPDIFVEARKRKRREETGKLHERLEAE